jgi:biotin carboxylase
VPEVVLVAGRGPMAARAIRSCQLAGSKVVAVYSEADGNAVHVRSADESVLLGPPPPESSYLDIGALIEAAQVSGAQAILPVHAVLAGSPELARASTDAGLLWLGADPEALDAVQRAGWGAEVAVPAESPGWVIGVADGFRIDGLVVRRTRAAAANLCWTSAQEPSGVDIEGLPSSAELLASLSKLVVDHGWRGLVSVAFGPDGAPLAIRGGVPDQLGLVELRAGRDLLLAAIALAEDGSPPTGVPGFPAAVGCSLRATAVPEEGQHATITELTGPRDADVWWEPGYAVGDSLSSWYDPVLAVVGVPGGDLPGALSQFQDAMTEIRIAPVPNDLEQLRQRAQDVTARLASAAS